MKEINSQLTKWIEFKRFKIRGGFKIGTCEKSFELLESRVKSNFERRKNRRK